MISKTVIPKSISKWFRQLMITSHKRRRVNTQTEQAVISVSKESKTVRQRWNKEE